MTDREDKTLVARAARQLATISLEYADGEFLGSEDDLLARLGISRPTLRQAAKIAESERMITVRRGSRGGIFAARPAVKDSIRAMNRYLRIRGVSLHEILVLDTVSESAAELAASSGDACLRSRLASMIGELDRLETPSHFIDYDVRFSHLLGEMSGNPVVEVIIAMTYSFGLDEQGIYLYTEQSERDAARQVFADIGEAILKGDRELARFMMQRRLRMMREWIEAADPSQFGPASKFTQAGD